jgi:predicted nucleic acid-binding protein
LETNLADDDADVHVPALCDVEVASALRRLWLSHTLSATRRDEALADYIDLPLTRHAHLTLLPRVLELGANLSAYDAVYAALAEALEAELITADDRLRRGIAAHTNVRVL